jgi:putative FmdB family regulatory protein
MPAYEYQCKCGDTTTVVRSITAEENKPICVKCALEMIRVFDKPAVTFKGDGWAGKEK